MEKILTDLFLARITGSEAFYKITSQLDYDHENDEFLKEVLVKLEKGEINLDEASGYIEGLK